MLPLDRMPGPKLRAAIAAAERVAMAHVDSAILHGRGNWRFTDMQKAAAEGDRSARIYIDAHEYARTLRNELERRMTYHGNHVPIKRKENPVATRKKAPTAAQLRARAQFTKVMKSGGFSARKARVKRKPAPRRTNPVGKRSGGARSPWATNVGFPDFKTASRGMAGRSTNPIRPVMSYVVHEARHGVKGMPVASFAAKADAVQYARAWVKLHKCPAMIAGQGER